MTSRDILKRYLDTLTAGCAETVSTYSECLTAIEDCLDKGDKYSSVWLNYQSLWDMDMGVICSRVGEDLNLWQKLLNDIKSVISLLVN